MDIVGAAAHTGADKTATPAVNAYSGESELMNSTLRPLTRPRRKERLPAVKRESFNKAHKSLHLVSVHTYEMGGNRTARSLA